MKKETKKTIVEFKDVVRTYGEGEALQYAVNHVNFTIEEGEFVVNFRTVRCRKINCA